MINIDDGGGSEDLFIIGEKVNKSKKGKTHEATHQVVVCIRCYVMLRNLSFLAAD